jgi:hypothetical protein
VPKNYWMNGQSSLKKKKQVLTLRNKTVNIPEQ